ncbi:acyclic terpene utilization AtuA family protein [Mycobacterium sp.]|uniref:acyclic terpene utilization AtuA family protein n=1 Tax=Mycobacterium sp. TaxID=1785 RepID=UPI003D0C1259
MTALTTILTPTGMLGYGYPEADFWECIERGVDAIVVDSGSTDPGPYLLGRGELLVDESAYLRDLTPMVAAAARHHIPLIVSSAGGAGIAAQVDRIAELIVDIAERDGHRLTMARMYSDIDPEVVIQRLDNGDVAANVRGEVPTRADVESCTNIVAQIGAEPFAKVLAEGVDVIVAGRAYDPAPHAAWGIAKDVDPGIAWHAGKILECGGACCEPKGSGVLATLERDAFVLTPMSPGARCTPLSVAAHTLYEKARPDLLPGPDGVLDLTGCTYTAVDERTVRVTGSRHRPQPPTLKLEGAAVVGHRAVFIGGVRDPILIAGIDAFLDTLRGHLSALYPQLGDGTAQLHFHIYGRNAVMGEREPINATAHEVGILGEITAPTPELAKAIASMARIGVLHLPYPGQVATAGNLALPLNPMENSIGPVCAFRLYHVMGADGLQPTRTRIEQIGTP